MTNQAAVLVETVAPQVALVMLNRAERLNALDYEMVDGLGDAFRAIGKNESFRAAILTGAGRGFCAGMNIANAVNRDAQRAVGPVERLKNQERFAAVVREIRKLRIPVIAAVNGPAAGAGFGFALAADIRLAAESASFHIAAIKIGLSAGECGISYHLPRLVGASRAFEIMLTGRRVDANEAGRIGLVSSVVPDDALLASCVDVANAIVANSPFAVWMTKQVAWKNLDQGFDAAIELENRTQILSVMTKDSAEAMTAFIEKRSPLLTGE